MKELLRGIWALIWAIVVSILMFSIGTLYSFGYAVWYSVTLKNGMHFSNFGGDLLMASHLHRNNKKLVS